MKRWLKRVAVGLLALMLVGVGTGVLVLRSQWFVDQLKLRILDEAQKATGARVELATLKFDWSRMEAEAGGLVLHGKEAPEEMPLLTVRSITLGLRIISLFERKIDLLSLRIIEPRARIVIYADGSTNIPGAGGQPDRLWTDDVLNLKVGTYEVADGILDYDNRRIPFGTHGENLRVHMTYDRGAPSYGGELSADAVRIKPPGYQPIVSSVETAFTLERDRVRFSKLRWTAPGTSADMSGTLDDLRHPHGTFAVRARTAMREIAKEFRLPVDPAGTAAFDGSLTVAFAEPFEYKLRGAVTGQGLRYEQGRVHIEGAAVKANLEASSDGAVLRAIRAQALGATVEGELHVEQWRYVQMSGTLASLDLRRAASLVTDRAVPWDATLAGPFEVQVTRGLENMAVKTTLEIAPVEGSERVEGHVELAYDQVLGTIAMGASSFATAATRLEVEGTLGKTLRVRGRTTRLEDLAPAIAFIRGSDPGESPLKLNNGSVSVDGSVTGKLDDPQFRGQASVVNGQVKDFRFDRFAADMTANQREVTARGLTAARGKTTVAGDLALTFRAGEAGNFMNSEIVAQLNVRNADVAEVSHELGITTPVTGTGSAAVRLSGSMERPEALMALDVQEPVALGETMDRVRASVRYVPGRLEVSDGIASDSGSEVRFQGTYTHPQDSWRSGALTFQASTPNLPSARIERLATFQHKVSGLLSGNLQGSGTVDASGFTLTSATANTNVKQFTFDGQSIGDVAIEAKTQGQDLAVTAHGNVRESRVDAAGNWKLEGDLPGTATVHFSRISIDTLQDLVMREQASAPPSVNGYAEGDATVRVALRKPRDFSAEVRLATLEANPKENPAARFGLTQEDLIVKNSEPVVLDLTSQQATVRSAKFTGLNTSLDVSGTVAFNADAGASLNVRGDIDLIILQLLRRDLQAKGKATVAVSIRGSLQNPQVNGDLTLRNASLYLPDLPNGVDDASGKISFDLVQQSTLVAGTQRPSARAARVWTARVDNVTAEVGGGQVGINGTLGVAEGLSYNLRAQARRVRIRYPQDVSTTFNADLDLKGTSQASTLSGTVSLVRTAFKVSTDFGQLLAKSSQASPAIGMDNEYLSGMQLNVRIQSGPAFQVETSLSSLASDLDADVNLRLLGTPSRPVLQGNITVNRGEIQMEGNRFTVDRGDIRFLNRLKIEPNIDMELTTRAGGVTVNVSLTGTLPGLKMNLSSDPPHERAEIFNLLAVGRDPNSTTDLLANGSNTGTSAFVEAGGSVLSQALLSQTSSKTQRFFGARVKLDPTLTGVDNLPQARLTLEQQVSKDITLTYITNLNRSQEQLVRVQWDMSKEWSAVAVRDANGLFSIDFQFRKRLK